MAQSSSAQREPSMEEILASIRRIIEDSDTTQKEPIHAVAQPQTEIPAPANDVREYEAPELDRFRSKFAPEDLPFLAEPPPILAPVGAHVTAEPLVSAVTLDQAEAAEGSKPVEADAGMHIDEPKAEAPVADRKTFQAGGLEAAQELEIDLQFERAMAEDPTGSTGPSELRSYQPTADLPPARPAIVSEQTGRQVAAAFGELSEAFAASRQKNFDELAEEMMRPMLQDWLDNNLPTLVERLVREEIERVARGGSHSAKP